MMDRPRTDGREEWVWSARAAGLVDRRSYLVRAARGRHVVHLGCADEHLTTARAGTGGLLHEELMKVSRSLVGVDRSERALGALSEIVPGEYVVGDVEHLEGVDLPARCDLVIASELIEHLGCPSRFLQGLRGYLTATSAGAIITTPNAYSWQLQVRLALSGKEWVHPDHRHVYTPATLTRAVESEGLRIDRMLAHAWRRPRGVRARLVDACDAVLLGANPWLAPGLVAEVSAR